VNDHGRGARLRRVAARQGLQLMKCRARDPRAVGFDTYQIADPVIGSLYSQEGRDSGYGLTLDEVAQALGESQT
jgi:hypothetical protein